MVLVTEKIKVTESGKDCHLIKLLIKMIMIIMIIILLLLSLLLSKMELLSKNLNEWYGRSDGFGNKKIECLQ